MRGRRARRWLAGPATPLTAPPPGGRAVRPGIRRQRYATSLPTRVVPEPRPGYGRDVRHPSVPPVRWLAVPLAVASALAQVGGSIGRAHASGGHVGALGVVLLLLGPLAILLLNRWPLVPLGVAITAAVAYAATGSRMGPIFVAPLAALVLEGVRRRAEWQSRARAARAASQDRTRAEERFAMARDLHDALGHRLTLINVHAGAALHTFDARPDNARQALTTIKAESHAALEEVRSVLDRLREPGAAAVRSPGPTLLDVAGLVTEGAGVRWSLEVTGERGEVPASVDAAAYRVVQEAVTNTHRHARAHHGRIRVRYADDTVSVSVADDGTGPSREARQESLADRGGQGLVGMRERVEALGGTLTLDAPSAGGFTVTAVLPRHQGLPR